MQNSIKIPYAVASYEEIVREDYFFVDKTQFIESLEKYKAPVFLRPRRFGKTLWCSILECYYDINKVKAFDILFGNTYIGQHPTSEKNKYLVMNFNFSKVTVKNDLDVIENSFNSICYSVISSFLTVYSKYFVGFAVEYLGNISDYLNSILSYIQTNNLPQLFIIIDEYDNFSNQLIQSHNDGLYNKLTTGDSFFRTFFKIIKAGTEDESIKRTYITGVLPITMDDLTSGFNIAEIITLEEQFVSMLGFTQQEVEAYLEAVFVAEKYDINNLDAIKVMMKNYYNGYQFILDAPKLYNSTILSFFLKKMVMNSGKVPIDFIDDNLKTDINWIKRLTIREENTKEMLSKLIFDNELRYDQNMVRSKFNMNQFFEKDFYPVSLFYLGMLTIKDDYSMGFPNQTMKTIFADYFNIVEKIEVSSGYTDYFIQFMKDLDIEKLFAGYWKTYIGQIPAQAMDKANENFFRTSFYELCNRYLSRNFVFNIEVNYPSGRSDWELLGKYHTEFKNIKYIIEFKHFSKEEARKQKVVSLKKPFEDDIIQVNGYATDILKDFPEYKMSKFIIYTIGAKKFKFFRVE